MANSQMALSQVGRRYFAYNQRQDYAKIARDFLRDDRPPKGSSYFELGFGDGLTFKELHRLRPDMRLFGMEVSGWAIRRAKRSFPFVTVAKSFDGIAFNLPSDSMDFCKAFFVLEYECNQPERLDRLVQELARVLKTDTGLLHVCCITTPTEDIGWEPLIDTNGMVVNLYTDVQWYKLFAQHFLVRKMIHYTDQCVQFDLVKSTRMLEPTGGQ